jgi:hypothetical protein
MRRQVISALHLLFKTLTSNAVPTHQRIAATTQQPQLGLMQKNLSTIGKTKK